jgi:protein-S-isoprenylcysteine O-methyltransferase Ste14
MEKGIPRSSPGVHFPPPLLFVLGLGLGLILNRRWPLALLPSGQTAFMLTLGWILIGSGGLLLLSALVTFFRMRTAIYPNQPATSIVTRGPYRFTRNPMYVALTSAYVGFVCLTNLLWPLLLLPVVLVVLRVFVIRREELYLTEAFGPAYAEYCQRVRRWL